MEIWNIYQVIYGKNNDVIHEDIASTLCNLAAAIGSIGERVEDAIQYLLKALVMQLKLHGDGKRHGVHPTIATTYNK